MKNDVLAEAETAARTLRERCGLRAFFALECEFYSTPALAEDAFSALKAQLGECHTLFQRLERERGRGQLEFSLNFTDDIAALCRGFEAIKAVCMDRPDGAVDFSAMPFESEPASGLHVHLHLEDMEGNRVFYKDDTHMSAPLQYALAGLLAGMPEAARILWRTEADIARARSAASDVPKTVSWGANNRSTSIRLPDKPPHSKHIEYRVASASADAAEVIYLMLQGVICGLEQQLALPPQIYGNAHDAQYQLQRLLQT